jgi:hypothetical protein
MSDESTNSRRLVIIQEMADPFDNLPPYADDFFNAIGRAVLMWGKLEQALDNLLLTAINIDALHGERREMLVALGRKLQLLKTTYKACPALLPLRGRANALAERIGNLSEDRHFVIHSTWLRFEDGPPPCIVLTNVKHNRGSVLTRKRSPTYPQLAQIAGAFQGARAETLSLLTATNECCGPEWEEAQQQALRGDDRFPPIEL